MRKHDDIEILIAEIEHIRINLNDGTLGPVFWEQAMKDFIARHGADLVAMLKELEKLRDLTGK
jgi:cobalamin biosynthesis protein CobD/CbiB